MLTADRGFPLRADASAASSLVRALWLNDSEPLSAAGAAAALLAGAALLLLALLAGALAAADELLLDEEEEQAVSATSAPAVTARPAAIFLFIQDLLVFEAGRRGSDKTPSPH